MDLFSKSFTFFRKLCTMILQDDTVKIIWVAAVDRIKAYKLCVIYFVLVCWPVEENMW